MCQSVEMDTITRNRKKFSTTKARNPFLATSHSMKRVIQLIALVALLGARFIESSTSEPSTSRDRQDNMKSIPKTSLNQQRKTLSSDLPSSTIPPSTITTTSGITNSEDRDLILVSSSTISYSNAVTNMTTTTTPSTTTSGLSSSARSDRTLFTQAPYEIPSTTQASLIANKENTSQQQQQRRHSNQHKQPFLPADLPNNIRQQSSVDNVLQFKSSKQSTGERDHIDQMSTSQSAAEPAMASSNTEQTVTQQHQFYQKPGNSPTNNRWTHFGARLRPLTSSNGLTNTHVEQQTAANIKTPTTVAYNHNGNNGNAPRQVAATEVTGNRAPVVSNNDLDDNDDLEDDQDNEALLYKMMQQQSFLMSPSWQDPPPITPNRGQMGQQRQQPSNGGKMFASNGGSENDASHQNDLSNSKKVIKLLKSYSHIHQVDDSDDQIRGTNTRQASRRPVSSAVANGWSANEPSGRARTYNNNNNNNNPRPSQQHIFVSSQPLTQDYSQSSSRQQPQADQNYVGDQPDSPEGAQGDDSNGPPPEEDEFECPNNGIFADEPSGCQSYHVCQSGAQVQQKFQCPIGTLFNNIILTCDFAHNVQCGNKPKPANPHAIAQQQPQIQENIYRQQPQQQQVLKSSNQKNQASHVHQTGQYNRPQQPQESRQWSPSAQNQGPKPLKVGPRQPPMQSAPKQQYTRPSAAQAQAVVAYPAPKPPVDESNDDSDDEALMPLVPATLPPRSQQQQQQQSYQQNLPYNPPPAAPQFQQGIPRQQQHFQGPQYQSNYDEASVSKPVFASQNDEANKLSELSISKPTTISDGPTEFKLVINHVAPKSTLGPPATFADGKKLQTTSEPRPKPQSMVVVNQVAPKPVAKSSNSQKLYSPSAQRSNANPRQTGQPKQQVPRVSNIGSQRQASLTRPVHVEADSPLGTGSGTSPEKQQSTGLVDLTNNRKQTVSSEAINDGLLLIVRHPTTTTTTSHNNQVNGQDRSRSDYNKPQVAATMRKDAINGVAHKHQSSGQAFAVAPSLVRPDSPIDGQLFPNVQRLLSASQGETSSLGHLTAQSTNYVQHAAAEPAQQFSRQQASPVAGQQQTGGTINQMLRAIQLPALPAMSLPKPKVNEQPTRSYGDGIGTAGSNNLKITNQIVEQNKQRSKRAKRLKAAQPPAAEHSARPTVSTPKSESNPKQRQQSTGDQPVTIITDLPRGSSTNGAPSSKPEQVALAKRRQQQ